MRLTQIRDFVAVIEAGSIRAGARQLGVSQPAITKSLRSLESELHVQLVQRTSRGIVPTAPGRAFFARARLAHGELRKAQLEAAQFAEHRASTVAFGIGPAAGSLLVPDALTGFQSQFPKMGVRIVEGLAHVLMPRVRDGSLDFVVGPRLAGPLEPGVSFRPLFRNDYVIVGRKGHPLRGARSMGALARARWLSLLPSGHPDDPLDRIFAATGLRPPEQPIHCESHHIIVSLLARSDMLGVMSRRLAAEPFAAQMLERIDIGVGLPAFSVGIFALADAPLTSSAAAMAGALERAARRLKRSSA